jgi:lysophospholipase L1-like esterase
VREAYRRFVAEGKGSESPMDSVTGQVFLGGAQLVTEMKGRLDGEALAAETAIPRIQREVGFVDVEVVIAEIAYEYGITAEELSERWRRGNERAVAIYLSRRLTGLSGVVLGKRFGITAARVSQLVKSIEQDEKLTFGGKPAVTIAKGGSVLSDPVAMEVAALQELAVTFFLPTQTGTSTIHSTALQTAYITRNGDATAAAAFPPGETDDSRYFLTDLEVASGAGTRSIVIVGDSITDGVGSANDRNARWPDLFATRLQESQALASMSVVNSGISGNRILNDGVSPFLGPSALSRFEGDALSKPGVRWILLFEGINDIAGSDMLASTKEHVSAGQIVDGMKTLVASARAKGIKIGGATLLPFSGVKKAFIHSEAGEAKRQAVNAWIRTAGAFDAVFDFERVTRDPAHPDRLLPAFDSGDHLHPNGAGYQAMAASIDLRLFNWEK